MTNATQESTEIPNLSSTEENIAPDNLMVFNSESEAKDLNARLQEMDKELQTLSEHLDSSHNNLQEGFEKILSEVKVEVQEETQGVLAETKDTQLKLGYLEGSYQTLEKKSEDLAKETARLTLLLDQSTQENKQSIDSLEESSTENFNHISKEIESLDQQVGALTADYKKLAEESESLINEVSERTSNLAQTVSDNESDFKKLAQEIEAHNKKVESSLEQVDQNFSFHDEKISKLHEKDNELESQNEALQSLLQKTEIEYKQSVASLEENLDEKITSVSDEAKQDHQALNAEHESLAQRTVQLESKAEQLDTELQALETKQQAQFSEHEEKLSAQDSNLSEHSNRLEQLNEVDEELSRRAQGLKETTERLNEHGQVLEKTTVYLQKQSNELDEAVTQLNDQNERLEEKTDGLGLQIVTNAQQERHHFQTMTMALSIVAILTVLGLIYSFINQQSLWQSSMDNDVAVERRVNMQISEQQVELSEHQTRLMVAEQNRKVLTDKLSDLQTQLKVEQEKADGLLIASQEKSKKIVQLKGDLKVIDGNVQFLNNSVGPLRDFNRYTGKQMQDSKWLAQQPAEHFAIQLTSVDSQQKLYQFIEKHGYSMHEDIAWFTINSKGKDYYILTYGSFNDLSQARVALSQFSPTVIEQSPGIARLKDIQAFIQ